MARGGAPSLEMIIVECLEVFWVLGASVILQLGHCNGWLSCTNLAPSVLIAPLSHQPKNSWQKKGGSEHIKISAARTPSSTWNTEEENNLLKVLTIPPCG